MNAGRSHSLNIDKALPTLLALAGLAYYLCYYNYGINLLDEGYVVDSVVRLLDGEVIYRDFYSTYAPGRFYLIAALFRLFGTDLLVVRLLWVVVHLFSAVLAYAVARRLSPPPLAFLAGFLVVLAPGPWHKAFIIFTPLLCLWLYLNFLERPGLFWSAASGLGTAAALLLRQDIGVYGAAVFAVLALYLMMAGGKNAVWAPAGFLAAMTAVLFPVIGYFYIKGGLQPMLFQTFVDSRAGVSAMSLPFPGLSGMFTGGPVHALIVLLFYMPLALYVAGWSVFIKDAFSRGYGNMDARLLAVLLMGSLCLLQIKNRSDLPHLWQALPVSYVLAMALISRCQGGSKAGLGRKTAVYAAGLAFGVVVAVCGLNSPASGSVALRKGNDTILNLPAARVYVRKELAVQLEEVAGYIQSATPPGSCILAAPDIGLMYFLADRKNPVAFTHFHKGLFVEDRIQQEVVEELRDKVSLVVMDKKEVDQGYPNRLFRNYAPLVDAYIFSNYSKVKETDDYVVMTRRPAPGGESGG